MKSYFHFAVFAMIIWLCEMYDHPVRNVIVFMIGMASGELIVYLVRVWLRTKPRDSEYK